MPYMTDEDLAEFKEKSTLRLVRSVNVSEFLDSSDRTLALYIKQQGDQKYYKHIYMEGGFIHVLSYLAYREAPNENFTRHYAMGREFRAETLNLPHSEASVTDLEFAYLLLKKGEVLDIRESVAREIDEDGFYAERKKPKK